MDARGTPHATDHYRCSLCNILKHRSAFHKDKNTSRGHRSSCKDCRIPYSKQNKLKKYGLTLQDFELRLVYQNMQCACCDRKMELNTKRKSRMACVDHDHDTGAVRDLLCGRCNLALGNIDDSSAIAEKLRQYLRKWGK